MNTNNIALLIAFGLIIALIAIAICEAIWRRRFMERMKQGKE